MSRQQLFSAIEKAIFEFGRKAKLIIFLVDGTSSVPERGFKTMVHTLRTIVNHLPIGNDNDQCLVALVQYSDYTKIECPLTSDPLQFHNALDSMKQIEGTNNEDRALQTCIRMFQESGREGARLIIHLTDGELKGNWKTASTQAKVQYKIDIISIGIGENIDAENIRTFASPRLSFFIKDYDQLQEFFQHLDYAPLPTPVIKDNYVTKIDATMIAVELQNWTMVNDTAKYHVEMRRANTSEVWRRMNSHTETTTIWVENLQPQTEYQLRVVVEMKSGRTTPPSKEITFKTLPLCPYHKIASDKRKLMQEVGNKLKILKNYEFFQETKKLGIKRLRVLFCGAPGAGKTSLMSTIAYIATGRFQERGARGESTETITRVVRGLEEFEPLLLIDTPGMNENNLQTYEKYLYYGGIKIGYDEEKPDPQFLRHKEELSIKEQVHCVVLLVSVEELPSEAILSMIKQQYRVILNHGRNALILLTKIDKIDPRIKLSQPDSIHLAYESGVVYYYRQTLAKELGVSVDHILPVVCYDAFPNEINPWISLLHIEWLEKAIKIADSFCKTTFDDYKQLIIEEKNSGQKISDKELIAKILEEEETAKSIINNNNNTNNNNSSTTPSVCVTTSFTVSKQEQPPEVVEIPVFSPRPQQYQAADVIYMPVNNSTIDLLKRKLCEVLKLNHPNQIETIIAKRKENEANVYRQISYDDDVRTLINLVKQGTEVCLVVYFRDNCTIL